MSTAEEDILILERALHWRAAPPLPWHSLASSLTLHVMAVVLWGLTWHGPAAAKTPPGETVIRYFVPLTFPAPPPTPRVLLTAGGGLAPPPIESPDTPEATATVNLSSIRLDIATDVGNQLPAVVEAQHGMLALLEKDDLEMARYVIQPPDWEPHPVMLDISHSLRFSMKPPRKWPVFQQIADRYGIDLDRYVGCAVFDAAFSRCLKEAIRRKLSPGATGAVTSVRFAFASESTCGIEVLEINR